MAQYDQTSIVKAAEKLGYTALDLVNAVPALRSVAPLNRATDDDIITGRVPVIAWNRAADLACDRWLAQISTRPTAAGYRTVLSPVYGEGRVYDEQPGATQYRGSAGEYSVQIWDES